VSGLTKGNGIVGVSQRWGKSISQAGFKWIGMSQSARYVPSPVCLEQIHRQCNCPSTGATAKTAPRLTRETQNAHLLPPSLRCQPKSQYYKPNRTNWKSTVKTISKIYTVPNYSPLDLNTGNLIWVELPTRLQSIFNVERLGQTYALTHAAAMFNDRYHTYQGQFMPGGSGYSKLSVPKPKGYTTLGAHSPALGLLSTNRKTRHTNSNRATTKPLNKRTLVFWHIVSLTPRH